MQVRIAIAVDHDQQRWIAYGASDTPEREVVATLRDIVPGHAVTIWLEVQVPEQEPTTVPARFTLHSSRSNGNGKVTGPPETGPLARDGHSEPVSDGRRRIEED
jgi:hypothetical protein